MLIEVVWWVLPIVQITVVLMRAFGGVDWSWWVVLLPLETIVAAIICFCVYLMTTKGNPFQ